MAGVVDEVKLKAWRRRLADFQASGLSVAAFCRRENIGLVGFTIGLARCAKPARRTAKPVLAGMVVPRAEVARAEVVRAGVVVRAEVVSRAEVVLPTFTLGNCLLLVEHAGRLVRDKKASISAELADIFERLGTSAELWQARIKRLSGGRLLGRFLGGSKARLAEVAQRLGVSRVANLKATG